MKIKRISHVAILAVIAVASLSFLYRGHQAAPDVTFKIIDGRTLTLNQYQGRPVLIDFWATDCRSCMHELPDLIALYNALSNKGFEIIGVAMPYDRPDMVLKAKEEKKIPYPIALDINGEITAAFGQVQVTPTHFLIAPDGKIVERIVGVIEPQVLREKIETMLPQKPI